MGAPRHHVGVSIHAVQPAKTLGAGEGGARYLDPRVIIWLSLYKYDQLIPFFFYSKSLVVQWLR